jgi:pullulanase/glycogen debranching enzyme
MTDFVKRAIVLRKRIPLLNGRRFLQGKGGPGGIPDITWFGPEGKELNWDDPEGRSLAFQLDGSEWTWEDGEVSAEAAETAGGGTAGEEAETGLPGSERRQRQRRARRYYFIFNMAPEDHVFSLPLLPDGRAWRRVADTSLEDGEDFLPHGKEAPLLDPGSYRAAARSTVILLD